MPIEAAFVGGAGTGKTFQLIAAVEASAKKRAWNDYEAVLALSFMHGSRRRLMTRLAQLRRAGVPVQVETIDSFCLRIVNRFRRCLGRSLPVIPSETGGWGANTRNLEATFVEIRLAALELLTESSVRHSVAISYPMMVVDEFQDCSPHLVEIIALLAGGSQALIAADPFQHLELSSTTCPAENWLSANSSPTELEHVHRTNDSTLLNSAKALRNGVACGNCVSVLGVTGPGIAAWEAAKLLAWNGWNRGSTALITPTKDPFVEKTLASLGKQLGKKRPIGPFPFHWFEESQLETLIRQSFDCIDEVVDVDQLRQASRSNTSVVVCRISASAYRLARLRGESSMPMTEVLRLAKNFANQATVSPRRRVAMTVHSAKNQEFDNVVVLWPHKIRDDPLYQRKLLYNAITRARQRAIVLVQGGPKRVEKDATLALLTLAGCTGK